ncbi:TetR/AcrR family transcriptional regulator [Halocynthiibacter namhaensis]|uniref:TetR/AcrR family transcriptional regulator n=1 Tax=Halocynthiibacter namhaensis TaxID=1290553 RepID=UPI000578FF8C|nr:TetR/AcrR family transcriptional regulator [Halocynthiibacter namhaensis]
MARKTGSHSEITGPRVRSAAEQLFARHGYASVSMRRIAAEVGVQAGALYLYTKDKQALLFDMMDAHMVALLEAWQDIDPAGAPMQRLEALVRFHIRFHMERQDAVFIAYMELRNLTPDNYAAITERRKAYEQVFEGIVSDGLAAGDFAVEDAHLSAMAVIAMLTGVNTWYREGGRLSLERVEEIYWDMVRKSLLG